MSRWERVGMGVGVGPERMETDPAFDSGAKLGDAFHPS